MWRRPVSLGFLAVALATAVLHADSPLTSTDIATAYADLAAVKEARATKKAAGEVLRFLVGTEPNDRKAAVVNALGWQTPGNAEAFLNGLAAARGVSPAEIKLAHLTAADRFVLGYMRALETYDAPAAIKPGALDVWGATPLQLLDQAAATLPNDFTVHYVRALVDAQRVMADSWCSVFMATDRVIQKFPARRRNMRPAAVAAVQSYMEGYKSDCTAAPKRPVPANTPPPLTAEHNQIYSLARLGDTIVAGTQAGIVVWHPDQSKPIASRNEQICSTVFTWQGAVWAGCYGTVVRWDGHAWKGYLQDPARADSAFEPFAGPAGELLVRNGRDIWKYDTAADTFTPVRLNVGADPYAALFRKNGELWRIDFLHAVVGPQRSYALRSTAYPGSDPRKLTEDAAGRLWVVDFERGMFRLDDASGRFEHQDGLDRAGSDVAVDPARGRTWMLHYTVGPVVHDRQKPGTVTAVDLKNLEFMRDLLIDERTGDVWVAGWTGLARLREDKGKWKIDIWRAGGR